MKIRSVETFVLDLPTLRPLQTSFAKLESLETVIVRLLSEDGVSGLGEACTIGPATWGSESAESIRVAIERYQTYDRIWPKPLLDESPHGFGGFGRTAVSNQHAFDGATSVADSDQWSHSLFNESKQLMRWILVGVAE